MRTVPEEVIVKTSVWVGPPKEQPRVRVDFGPSAFQTFVYFDDVPQNLVVWMAFSASATRKDLTVLYADLISLPSKEPNADFVAYLKKSGVVVNVWNLREQDADLVEKARLPATTIHELYADLLRACYGAEHGTQAAKHLLRTKVSE